MTLNYKTWTVQTFKLNYQRGVILTVRNVDLVAGCIIKQKYGLRVLL